MITKPVKYTPEFVLSECTAMLQEIRDDKEIVLLGQLFGTRDYSGQRFSEWDHAFADNEMISETIKKIRELLEDRINLGGLKGSLNPTMTIFNLKNNYGWKDTKDHTSSDRSMSPAPTKIEIVPGEK